MLVTIAHFGGIKIVFVRDIARIAPNHPEQTPHSQHPEEPKASPVCYGAAIEGLLCIVPLPKRKIVSHFHHEKTVGIQ